MIRQNNRTCFLDLLRIIACFCVIINHTTGEQFLCRVPFDPNWYLFLTYFFASKIAIPLFFMISGYLLLNKKDTWKKTLSRVCRIVLLLIFCGFMHRIYRAIHSPDASLMQVLGEVLMIHQKMPHLSSWYFYWYIGMLLMLPFLQKMTALMEKTDYHVFFGISLFFYSAVPILAHYWDVFSYTEEFYIPLFGNSICMLLMGQYFSKFEIRKTKTGFCGALAVFVLMVLMNVTATYFEYYAAGGENYLFFDDRTRLTIVIQSICAFYLATFVTVPAKLERIIIFIGERTLGIFVFAVILQDVALPLLSGMSNVIHPFAATVVFQLLVFFGALLVTSILKKLPFFREIL